LLAYPFLQKHQPFKLSNQQLQKLRVKSIEKPEKEKKTNINTNISYTCVS